MGKSLALAPLRKRKRSSLRGAAAPSNMNVETAHLAVSESPNPQITSLHRNRGFVQGKPCGTVLVAIWQDVDISCWDEMWNWRALHWSSQTPRPKLKIPLHFPLRRRKEPPCLGSAWTGLGIITLFFLSVMKWWYFHCCSKEVYLKLHWQAL